MTSQAPAYFRAVAIDYDGTLADGQVKPDTLAVLAEARAGQIRVILVTGRIMSELQTVFPGALNHVDAIVAENGAVLATRAGSRLLAAPLGCAMGAGLAARGVAHRCGRVLVACSAADEPTASEVIRELGLDCRLVRNRGELMILPAGVTKGAGLTEALADMGLSRHNAIGVGDAENDHSLLDVCEVGVAVGNAVDSSGCGHASCRHCQAPRRATRAGGAGLAAASPPAGGLHRRGPGNRSRASPAQVRPGRR